jgi:molybdate transport system substrate-binding protein
MRLSRLLLTATLISIMFFSTLSCRDDRNETILVAVAANALQVMEILADDFEEMYPSVSVEISSASSGTLTTQIISGAPFDLFLSADTGYPAVLLEKGFAKGSAVIYARGKLVLFSHQTLDFNGVFSEKLFEHAQTIAMADPETAPYGRATMQFLERSGIYTAISEKLAISGSVNHALQQTLLSSDMGFIPSSALHYDSFPESKRGDSHVIPLPVDLYEPIDQAMVILTGGESNPEMVELLFQFLLSSEAGKQFSRHGYIPGSDLDRMTRIVVDTGNKQSG